MSEQEHGATPDAVEVQRHLERIVRSLVAMTNRGGDIYLHERWAVRQRNVAVEAGRLDEAALWDAHAALARLLIDTKENA